MSESQGAKGQATRLRELGDPEFMAQWAALRSSLFFTPKHEPWYPKLKRRYDDAAVEYRRRMDGALCYAQVQTIAREQYGRPCTHREGAL